MTPDIALNLIVGCSSFALGAYVGWRYSYMSETKILDKGKL